MPNPNSKKRGLKQPYNHPGDKYQGQRPVGTLTERPPPKAAFKNHRTCRREAAKTGVALRAPDVCAPMRAGARSAPLPTRLRPHGMAPRPDGLRTRGCGMCAVDHRWGRTPCARRRRRHLKTIAHSGATAPMFTTHQRLEQPHRVEPVDNRHYNDDDENPTNRIASLVARPPLLDHFLGH